MQEVTDARMPCEHRQCINAMRRLAIIEIGPKQCPACGRFVKFAPSQVQIANALLAIGLAASVALSMQFRSWLPYILLIAFYATGRMWVVKRAILQEATKPSGLSVVWFALFAIFIFVLIKVI